MIQNQYQTTYIHTNATTVIAAAGNITVHTVTIPAAATGTVTFQDKDGNAYFVFPATSIGSYILDVSCPKGLTVVTSASDTVIVSTQTP